MSGSASNPAQKPALAGLARKYTHPVGEYHKSIAHTGKSGLTPVQSRPPGADSPTTNQKKDLEVLVGYQVFRCEGFTPNRFVDLEAFAPRYDSWNLESRSDGSIYFDSLNVPIHPLFARGK